MPFGPLRDESVMKAIPALPRRRSKRTSFRYEPFEAISGGNRIVLNGALVLRSIPTSLGPPGTAPFISGLPVSSTQSRSLGSTTTLCTETKALAAGLSAPGSGQRLISASGYASTRPFFTSPTVTSTGSPQRGKFTNTRPACETVTPVGIAVSKSATTSSCPTGRAAGSLYGSRAASAALTVARATPISSSTRRCAGSAIEVGARSSGIGERSQPAAVSAARINAARRMPAIVQDTSQGQRGLVLARAV